MKHRVVQHVATALVAVALSGVAFAQANLPLPPDRLATVLPTAAWSDVSRGKVETTSDTVPIKRSSAKVMYEGKRGSTDPFRATFTIGDEGAYGAQMYGYGADYLKKDVKGDSQKSMVLPGGRRVLYTSYTKDSMALETFVADRFVVRTSCTTSDQAKCAEAFSKWDFKAVEAIKP